MSCLRLTYAAAALLALTALSACSGAVDRAGGSAGDDVTTLTFAQPNDGDPPPQLQAWADQVDRLTDGTVKIAFENGWRVGEVEYEAGTLEDVQAGDVDLAWVGARVFDRVGVTSFQALLAPLLVDSHDLQRAVFEDGIPEEMLSGVQEIDLTGIGVLPGPMRKLLGIDGAYVRPQDFSGKVVGLQDSALAEVTFRTLGATARAVPTSASLDGLDAYEQQLDSITGNGYQDDAAAVTGDLNLWPRPLVIVAGAAVADRLDASELEALREASRLAATDALVGSAKADQESAELVCDTDLTVAASGEAGLAALAERLEPVYTTLREDETTAGYLERIEALKETTGAGPDVASCDDDTDPAGAVPNGTYQGTVTPADVEKHCGPDYPPDAPLGSVPPDGVTLELHVDGERVVQSEFPAGEPQKKAVGWTGTYRAYRDTLELLETGTTEPFAVTWALDGKRLQLSDWPFPGCDGVIVWTAHDWTRVD
ncbi:TRAP transporter substrate-binding protein [Mumia sp. DW29H23]|uniref:TRAP transporter substrate-binding protein n=1 Tax=Mumia sp. DW29H23 TaxID=3421241 RepID=UPI003D68514C